MSSDFQSSDQLATIAQELRSVDRPSADLMYSLAEKTSRRLQRQSANFTQLDRLIAAGALTEAILLLVEFELPLWKLRRIAYDEGEWHCALSRERELPEWLDQAIEAYHPDLTVAIALSYVEALKAAAPSRRLAGPTVPQVGTRCFETFLCDNYA